MAPICIAVLVVVFAGLVGKRPGAVAGMMEFAVLVAAFAFPEPAHGAFAFYRRPFLDIETPLAVKRRYEFVTARRAALGKFGVARKFEAHRFQRHGVTFQIGP